MKSIVLLLYVIMWKENNCALYSVDTFDKHFSMIIEHDVIIMYVISCQLFNT